MRRHDGERVSWWHVAAAAAGLVAANLLLRLGLRRPPPPRPPVLDPSFDDWAPRVVDHTPVPPEPRDARVRPVAAFVLGLAAFMGAIAVIVTGLQWFATGGLPSLAPPAAGVDEAPDGLAPPEPRLDTLPEDTLASVRATEAALLDYGWVDEAAGTTRLPIERAMELLADRGLPIAPGAENLRYEDAVTRWPSDASSGREESVQWP